jgi:ethanolamine utilization protein EutQ (cupin superfamily)
MSQGEVLSSYKVNFATMPWQNVRLDVRQKSRCDGRRQIRLIEFDTAQAPEGWCEVGHIGYVLKGALSVSFDGEIVSFEAGDGMFIPAGAASRHRAVSITPGTQLLMVEEA